MNNKPYYSDEESPRRIDLQDDEWDELEKWHRELWQRIELEHYGVKGGQGRSSASLVLSAWFLAFLLGAAFWVLVLAVVIGVI